MDYCCSDVDILFLSMVMLMVIVMDVRCLYSCFCLGDFILHLKASKSTKSFLDGTIKSGLSLVEEIID